MLSLNDDDGIFDHADFVVKDMKNDNVVKKEIEVSKMFNCVQESMKGYSFEWPYVSFSGIINNHVFLLNAYDKTIIHRIQIAEDNKNAHFKCLATFVTTTKDLFILTL